MTLICNYINRKEGYILLASDRRSTKQYDKEKKLVSIDSAIKLFYGSHYCIGIQGTVKTSKHDYLKVTSDLVKKNRHISENELLENIRNSFSIVNTDNEVIDLNLTISGRRQNSPNIFSYYFMSKNDYLINCLNNEEVIRFNSDINMKEIIYRQANIYMRQYINSNNIGSGYGEVSLIDFNRINTFKILGNMFLRFGENDRQYQLIGGKMDYCLIFKHCIITNIGN